MEPKFSVIIPVHNCERFVAYAVESALSQTCPAWEIIAIDDGSTDDTPKILESFRGKISIRTIKHSGSPAVPRNVGIQWSTGNFIAFLDADDVWFKDKLGKQARMCQLFPDAGFICGDYIARLPADGWRMSRHYSPGFLSQSPGKGLVFDRPLTNAFRELLNGNFVGSPSTVVLSRRVIDKIGGLNPLYPRAEDYEYWFRCAKYTRFLVMKDVLAYSRGRQREFPRDEIGVLENRKRLLLEVFTEHRDFLKENRLMDDCFSLLAENNRRQAVYYSGIGDRRQAFKLCLQSLLFSCSPENLGFWLRALVRLTLKRLKSARKPRTIPQSDKLTAPFPSGFTAASGGRGREFGAR